MRADVGRRTTHRGSRWRLVRGGKRKVLRALLRFAKEI